MIHFKRRFTLLAALFGLATLACGTVSVANQSDYSALVSVTLPGASSTDSHIYKPGELYDYYPESAGPYTVSVIPQEDYIATMDSLRAQILFVLYGYRTVIRPEYVVELTEQLANIDRTLSSLTTHSCTGNFVEDSDVTATLNMSKEGKITLSCPSSDSQSPEN